MTSLNPRPELLPKIPLLTRAEIDLLVASGAIRFPPKQGLVDKVAHRKKAVSNYPKRKLRMRVTPKWAARRKRMERELV